MFIIELDVNIFKLVLECLCQILLTGKAINFLRQVCQDRTLIRNREVVRIAEANQGMSLCASLQTVGCRLQECRPRQSLSRSEFCRRY